MHHCCGGENVNKIVLDVRGMTCRHCEMAVKEAVEAVHGVEKVDVDVEEGKVVVHYSGHIDRDRVKDAIQEAGYEVIS